MKVNIQELHRRLTEINDLSITERSTAKREARIQSRIEAEEREKVRMVEKFGHEAPYTYQEHFEAVFGDSMRELLKDMKEESPLGKSVSKHQFIGKCMEIPMKYQKKKLDK
ncbi:MAG: hypothetical protein ACTSRU_19460 [Candidatus Hodarchaeales archaeon]